MTIRVSVKKAYFKLSLLVHPSIATEHKKAVSTAKFKLLGKIYSILQNPEKRKVYDEIEQFDENCETNYKWLKYWQSLFVQSSVESIPDFNKQYIDSKAEIAEVKRAYILSKGNVRILLNCVPDDNSAKERIMRIIQRLIESGEVEEQNW